MTVMVFDTHGFIKIPQKAGFSQQQAEPGYAVMLLTQAGLNAALVKLL
ncbi:MAG: hypothetical protein KGZ80_08755 [Methylomonas sp.]|nr:hypothetical protein [Methylomonas sp.]